MIGELLKESRGLVRIRNPVAESLLWSDQALAIS
jgi:hypothetical protein